MRHNYSDRIQQQAYLSTTRLIQQQQQQQQQQNEQTRTTQNVVPLLQRATMGLIYRYLTHDDDFNLQQTDQDESCFTVQDYLSSVIRIRMILLAKARSVWFLLPQWCYRWFSPMHREEQDTLGPIRWMARRTLARARPGSPLHRLQHDKQHSHGLPQDLLDETITLLFAGQDTSAATLSWTLHLLSIHPGIQEQLYHQVRGIDAAAKQVLKIPLLDAVIKESMRLFPVAPFVVRRLVEDVVVVDKDNNNNNKDGPLVLPKGCLACLWIYSLHRNPAIWERPDDFWPERWLRKGDVSSSAADCTHAYMPYCLGPRNCLGQPLAHVVLRTMLTKLIQTYRFVDPQHDDHRNNNNNSDPSADTTCPPPRYKDMQAGFTILPLGGLELIMTPRN